MSKTLRRFLAVGIYAIIGSRILRFVCSAWFGPSETVTGVQCEQSGGLDQTADRGGEAGEPKALSDVDSANDPDGRATLQTSIAVLTGSLGFSALLLVLLALSGRLYYAALSAAAATAGFAHWAEASAQGSTRSLFRVVRLLSLGLPLILLWGYVQRSAGLTWGIRTLFALTLVSTAGLVAALTLGAGQSLRIYTFLSTSAAGMLLLASLAVPNAITGRTYDSSADEVLLLVSNPDSIRRATVFVDAGGAGPLVANLLSCHDTIALSFHFEVEAREDAGRALIVVGPSTATDSYEIDLSIAEPVVSGGDEHFASLSHKVAVNIRPNLQRLGSCTYPLPAILLGPGTPVEFDSNEKMTPIPADLVVNAPFLNQRASQPESPSANGRWRCDSGWEYWENCRVVAAVDHPGAEQARTFALLASGSLIGLIVQILWERLRHP